MQFDLAPMLKYFTLADCLDLGLRVILSAICGAIIGLERERRYKNAGLRTHIIVAIAGAILMIVSKYGFIDVTTIDGVRLTSDSGRVAAAVIQSIGFLGAGVIYVRKESIIGLTTAAGLWATVGIGMCFGAGMYVLGACTTAIIIIVQILLRIHHQHMPVQTVGIITCSLSKHNMKFNDLASKIQEIGGTLRDVTFQRDEEKGNIVKANVTFNDNMSTLEHVDMLKALKFIDSFEVYPNT